MIAAWAGCRAAAVAGLFDHLDGVQCWIKDRAWLFEWVNRGFLLNYALERVEQVIGRTDHDLSPAHLADQYRVDDERVLRGEPVESRVELVGRFDRTAIWSQTTKKPVVDRRGRIVGTVGMTRMLDAAVVASDREDAALGRVLAHMRLHVAGRCRIRRWPGSPAARCGPSSECSAGRCSSHPSTICGGRGCGWPVMRS